MRRASHGRRSPSAASLVAVAACSATRLSLDAASGRAASSSARFSKLFAPSKSSFSSIIFDVFTPSFTIQLPGTPRLRHFPHTSKHHSTILVAAYRLMSGASPLSSSLSCLLRPRLLTPQTPRNILRPPVHPPVRSCAPRPRSNRADTPIPVPAFSLRTSAVAVPRRHPSRHVPAHRQWLRSSKSWCSSRPSS